MFPVIRDSSGSGDLTIIVNTCDSYADVLDIFFYALKKYWPDPSYKIVINTENCFYNYPAITHNYDSLTNKDDWGARLLSALDTVETEFVLMLYDDFILEDFVDESMIAKVLNLMKHNDMISATYLTASQLLLDEATKHGAFIRVRDKADYCLNSLPAIWRKDILKKYTAPGDTPWAWEVFGSYRTYKDNPTFLSLDPVEKDIYNYNHAKGGAIYRGKWVRSVIDKVMKEYGGQIDWEIRGFSSELTHEKRSLIWKINFLKKGWDMVGYKIFYYLWYYVKCKLNVKS